MLFRFRVNVCHGTERQTDGQTGRGVTRNATSCESAA